MGRNSVFFQDRLFIEEFQSNTSLPMKIIENEKGWFVLIDLESIFKNIKPAENLSKSELSGAVLDTRAKDKVERKRGDC